MVLLVEADMTHLPTLAAVVVVQVVLLGLTQEQPMVVQVQQEKISQLLSVQAQQYSRLLVAVVAVAILAAQLVVQVVLQLVAQAETTTRLEVLQQQTAAQAVAARAVVQQEHGQAVQAVAVSYMFGLEQHKW